MRSLREDSGMLVCTQVREPVHNRQTQMLHLTPVASTFMLSALEALRS